MSYPTKRDWEDRPEWAQRRALDEAVRDCKDFIKKEKERKMRMEDFAMLLKDSKISDGHLTLKALAKEAAHSEEELTGLLNRLNSKLAG
ncbi:MAG: hypothetical protein PHU23_15800 [Dehalococcoidales bacterium]|nr:hypothetical protein [Dehalococcoidales bacterium]